jgi:hypothetical protein
MLVLIAIALALPPVFHVALPWWMKWQAPVAAVFGALIFWLVKRWPLSKRAAMAAGLGIISLWSVAAEAPLFETHFKSNQTLRPLGAALQENFREGDAIVCWGKFPEGLPFYSSRVITAANRPFFGGMNLHQVPFEFPGNQERMGELLLPDENALAQKLTSGQRILVMAPQKTSEHFQALVPSIPLRQLVQVGQWELFSNR